MRDSSLINTIILYIYCHLRTIKDTKHKWKCVVVIVDHVLIISRYSDYGLLIFLYLLRMELRIYDLHVGCNIVVWKLLY